MRRSAKIFKVLGALAIVLLFSSGLSDAQFRRRPNAWTYDGTIVWLTTSTDSVGIGTATPDFKLTVNGDMNIRSGSGLVVGHVVKIDFGATPEFQVLGTEVSDSSMGFAIFNDGASNAPDFRFLKSRGTTLNSNVLVVDGDRLGRIRFQGADGNDFNTTAAEFQVEVDGTASLNNVFGRFIWRTRTSGGLNEKMRLTGDGNLALGLTSPTGKLHIDQASTSGAVPVLRLDQGDIDDTFVDFIGTSAADGTRSISSDTTEDSAKFGAIRVEINGVTKWIRVYDDES